MKNQQHTSKKSYQLSRSKTGCIVWLVYILQGCNLFSYGQGRSIWDPFFKETNFFSNKWEQEIFSKYSNQTGTEPMFFFTSFENSASISKAELAAEAIKQEAGYLVRHRIKNNHRYLKKIFEHVHLVFLKKYKTYSNFNQLFDVHHFDCVTGTALYAAILDEMGIGYEMYETANHSYLIVRLGKEKALFESTDPLNGFITDPQVISETQARYAQEMAPDFNNLLGLVGYKDRPGNTLKVYSEQINLTQLAGLYYYNQAVVFYNIKNYKKSVNALEKAFVLYPSKRILTLLLVSIQEVLRMQTLTREDMKRYIAKTKFYSHEGQGFYD